MIQFDTTLASGTYSIAYDVDGDEVNGRQVSRLVFARATAPGCTAIDFDTLLAREDLAAGGMVDADDLRERLDEAAKAAEARDLASHHDVMPEDDGEPAYDLDEGFDPYAGQYTGDC